MNLSASTRLGPYEIVAPLGAGGMGQVWRAHDTRLKRDVAIKVLPAEFASDPERLERFEREARATAALSHPNILAVFDIGSHDGTPYIVEELVEGESLRELVKRGALAPAEALELGVQIARGLAAAHEKRIVHRDLKPDNVIVTRAGVAKILDFGLAKFVTPAASPGDATLTSVPTGATELGAVLGTAAYMAPEQAKGQAVDERADVFAFGIVLYELLTGQRPFVGGTATEIVAAILKDPPPPLPDSVPEVLRAIVARCLAKELEHRFASAGEVLQALQHVSSGERAPAWSAEVARPRRRRSVAVGLVAGSAIVAVGVLGVLRGWFGVGTGPALDPARVMVVPFDNLTSDASLAAIGRLTADAIGQGLVELGGVEVVAAPAGESSRDDASTLAAAHSSGAGAVVVGTYYLAGTDVELRGRVLDAKSGQPLFALKPERSPREQPDGAIDRVRQRTMTALGLHLNRTPALGGQTSPPLYGAYKEYLAAEKLAGLEWPAAVAHYERSAELDPDFWHARVRLFAAYRFAGNRAASDSMRKLIEKNHDQLCTADRIEVEYLDAMIAGRRLEQYRRARELFRIAPHDPAFTFAAARLALDFNRPGEALECIGDLADPRWDRFVGWTQPSWIIGVAAFSHHLLGQHEAELAVAEIGVRRYPDMLNVRQDEARALAALGRLGDLDRVVDESLAVRARSDTPGEVILTAAQELRAHGHADAARRMAARGADWYASLTGDDALGKGIPFNRVECLWLAERFEEARKLAEATWLAQPADVFTQGYRGITAARAGDAEVVAAMNRSLAAQDDTRRRGSCSWLQACIAAQSGDRDRAVELLRVAVAHGFASKGYLHVYAFLEPLHGYPPFEELIKPKG